MPRKIWRNDIWSGFELNRDSIKCYNIVLNKSNFQRCWPIILEWIVGQGLTAGPVSIRTLYFFLLFLFCLALISPAGGAPVPAGARPRVPRSWERFRNVSSIHLWQSVGPPPGAMEARTPEMPPAIRNRFRLPFISSIQSGQTKFPGGISISECYMVQRNSSFFNTKLWVLRADKLSRSTNETGIEPLNNRLITFGEHFYRFFFNYLFYAVIRILANK